MNDRRLSDVQNKALQQYILTSDSLAVTYGIIFLQKNISGSGRCLLKVRWPWELLESDPIPWLTPITFKLVSPKSSIFPFRPLRRFKMQAVICSFHSENSKGEPSTFCQDELSTFCQDELATAGLPILVDNNILILDCATITCKRSWSSCSVCGGGCCYSGGGCGGFCCGAAAGEVRRAGFSTRSASLSSLLMGRSWLPPSK